MKLIDIINNIFGITEKSDSARYYETHPEARKKKAKTDTKINSRPEQVKKRVESNKERRHATKAGKDVTGKDYDHKQDKFLETSKNRGQAEKSRLQGSTRKKK